MKKRSTNALLGLSKNEKKRKKIRSMSFSERSFWDTCNDKAIPCHPQTKSGDPLFSEAGGSMKNPVSQITIIAGPTASGKTDYSIKLAKDINAEIISADSRQIFKELKIGTAKPDFKVSDIQFDGSVLIDGIVHHGFDLVSIKDDFNVSMFLDFFIKCSFQIFAKNKNVILCGGTGLYIDACINGLSEIPEISSDIRKKIERMIENEGLDFIYQKLKKADPKSEVDPNNPRRVIRAYEVYLGTGVSMTEWREKALKNKPNYEYELLCLNPDREKLYERINKRVDWMFANGIIEETKLLLDDKIALDDIKKAGIGYEHIVKFLSKEISLDSAKEAMKKDTRNYAKRQLTWFRRYDFTKWVSNSSS